VLRVHVDKGANARIRRPGGYALRGVHVNTNQTSAADLGLPPTPAPTRWRTRTRTVGGHPSRLRRVELHVQAVSYGTHDTQEQVTAFYKKALGRYGDVIVLPGPFPVGTPTTTSEGLTCSDDGSAPTSKSIAATTGPTARAWS